MEPPENFIKQHTMNTQINFRYSKIALEQFAIFSENGPTASDDSQLNTQIQFSYDNSSRMICCRVSVVLSDKDMPVLKADLDSYFEIQPESIASLTAANERIIFEPPHLIQFASLCYGSLRGIIYAKTIQTPLCNFILPPIYFSDIMDKPFEVKLQ